MDEELVARKRSLPKDREEPIPEFVKDRSSSFVLYVTDRVLIGIREKAYSQPDCEIGGVLLGNRFSEGGTTVVLVEDYRPLTSQDASSIHFDFDVGAILKLRSELREAKDVYPVGWYHSHCGIGDPFMSTFDQRLHSGHFADSWYVSAVVGGGELGMPVGFWRMEDGKLIDIPEYNIQMTHAPSWRNQTRRLLRSMSHARGDSFVKLESLAPVLDTDLGLPDGGGLAQAFQVDADALELDASALAAAYRQIVHFSRQLVSMPAMSDDTDTILERLNRCDFLENAVDLCVSTEHLGVESAVVGDFCVGATLGKTAYQIVDFKLNRVQPLETKADAPIKAIASYTDGILMGLGQVILNIGRGFLNKQARKESGDGPESVHSLTVLHSGGDIRSIECRGNDFYVWYGNRIYRAEEGLTAQDASSFDLRGDPILSDYADIDQACFIRGGVLGCSLIATKESTLLSVIDEDGAVRASLSLPEYMQAWSLKSSASSSASLFILLDDGEHGQLVELSPDTLALVRHYLQGAQYEDRHMLHGLSVDATGRVFLHIGDRLVLMAKTGELEPHWYHRAKGLSYDLLAGNY